jgi:taurine dioxygenase
MTTVPVRPAAAGAFVREVADVDCAGADPDDVARIRRLLFEHRVLVLPGQRLTPWQYHRFMAALGTPVPHVLQHLTVQGFPDVLTISDHVLPDGTPTGVLDGGSYWHSDMSYLPRLGVATALYAVRAVDDSGGTAFLDLVQGWELVRRDPDLLAVLGCPSPQDAENLVVEHRFGNRRARTDPDAADQELTDEQRDTLPPTRHRLVERHPVTGRPALFAPAGTPSELAGLDPAASRAALDRLEDKLFAGLTPYTHRYRPGDLVLWDNMATLHRGVGVRPTTEVGRSRLLHRINVHYAEAIV